MPLIEPLETKEQQKIEDFVIVVDTSMSCKGELIKSFLEQTCAILQESESFFRRLHIHIIQCDDKVQEDVVIRSKKEFDDYMRHFTVRGFGGTDFRPGIRLCAGASGEKGIYAAAGTHLFYRWLWDISGKEAAV